MASACVNSIGISSIDCPPPTPPNFTSFSWLTPKKISCNHPPDDNMDQPDSLFPDSDPTPAVTSNSEFEFQLEGADVRMLPADELFSDGKLVPLQLSVQRQPPEQDTRIISEDKIGTISQVTTPKIRLRNDPLGPGPGPINDPGGYLFSPRAPTCSSRWKELLGFKRFYQNTNKQQREHKPTPAAAAAAPHLKSLKSFLHRTQKSSVSPHVDSSSASLTLPLIQDADNDSFSILSSRLSLSSSSCSSSGGHEHDDFPRHSLDSEKTNFRRSSNFSHYHRSRHLSKEKSLLSSENPESIRTNRSSLRKDAELISADSPRMNSSGKIVFHSLERSSSSPSTLNGGPRYKYRGMERSYSANVRYTPVLNVPVCSLRGSSSSTSTSKSAGVFGFPLFSPSQQRKDVGGGSVVSSASAGSGDANKGSRKNRSERA